MDRTERVARAMVHLLFLVGCVLMGMTGVHGDLALTGLGGVLYFGLWNKVTKP